jgi:hypothetical protein
MERFESDIAKSNAAAERCRKESNPMANVSTATSTRDAGLTFPRGMSNAESIVKREKHVATRIIQLVKSEVFRCIKFVNSAEMFQKAFVKVLEFERVPPNNRVLFQLTYKSCFNKALNTKRSSCEQLGAKIAWKAIADFKKRGEEFFAIDDLYAQENDNGKREKGILLVFGLILGMCMWGKYVEKGKENNAGFGGTR